LTTMTCVSSIETSNPAKYSIAALLFTPHSYRKADLIDFQGAAAHYPMLKNSENERSQKNGL
jgi:hypothetical protein